MELSVILVLLAALPLNSVFVYKFTELSGCSDSTDDAILLYNLDQNEIFFEDYNSGQQFGRLPPFVDPINFDNMYDYSIAKKSECLQIMKNVSAAMGHIPEAKVPPEFSIYTKHNVVPGEENNFICFVRNFYPPHITVNWTRNGVSVTERVYISQYSLNNDGTFNLFSTLTSSPSEGDEYSCTVEHQALDSPQTRTWDEPVVPPYETPSVTPTVVFAVGIVVGIVGLFTGMLFVIKASCFK
ncbi:rano class II histocompatibility antigen, B alpha chain-like [Tachysurus fulvidraco]|uniref:rano class II histocompatibility antigen, B alpha chain-like n=1 Tax=Tachysurus fulvidraco TaxID=1234273 RepID=UPI001FED7CAD|nr:rano class II histocompatibility antigen, B alpha chain-like [Tachysurus fulvidraco]